MNDPYDLERFLSAQDADGTFDRAQAELAAGDSTVTNTSSVGSAGLKRLRLEPTAFRRSARGPSAGSLAAA